MEFRDPKFHKSLSKERMEREFTFDPGADSPTDETHVTVGNLTRFAAQKQGTRGQGDKPKE